MISIDFALYLSPEKLSQYLDYFIDNFQNLTKSKDFKLKLYEEIQLGINTAGKKELSEKEYEIIQFTIDKDENLFYKIYSEYENLKNVTTDEKLETSINLLFDLVWRTSLNGIQIYQLKKRFVSDAIDFFALKSKPEPEDYVEGTPNPDQDFTEKPSFEALKIIFVDEDLFLKIDFSKLKPHNIIYNRLSDGFQLKSIGSISDFIILISYLRKLNIIKLEKGKDSLQVIKKIIFNTIGKSPHESQISRLMNRIVENEGSYELSKENQETLFRVESFMNAFIYKI